MIKAKLFGVFCLVSSLFVTMAGCSAETGDETRDGDQEVAASELQNVPSGRLPRTVQ